MCMAWAPLTQSMLTFTMPFHLTLSQTHHSVSTCWSLVGHCNSIGVPSFFQVFDTPFHWGSCWSLGYHSIGVSPGVWFVILLKYLWVLGLVFGKVHENEILSVYPLMFWQVIPSGYLLSFCSCWIRLWMWWKWPWWTEMRLSGISAMQADLTSPHHWDTVLFFFSFFNT